MGWFSSHAVEIQEEDDLAYVFAMSLVTQTQTLAYLLNDEVGCSDDYWFILTFYSYRYMMLQLSKSQL